MASPPTSNKAAPKKISQVAKDMSSFPIINCS
jgi:hypothetical protein